MGVLILSILVGIWSNFDYLGGLRLDSAVWYLYGTSASESNSAQSDSGQTSPGKLSEMPPSSVYPGKTLAPDHDFARDRGTGHGPSMSRLAFLAIAMVAFLACMLGGMTALAIRHALSERTNHMLGSSLLIAMGLWAVIQTILACFEEAEALPKRVSMSLFGFNEFMFLVLAQVMEDLILGMGAGFSDLDIVALAVSCGATSGLYLLLLTRRRVGPIAARIGTMMTKAGLMTTKVGRLTNKIWPITIVLGPRISLGAGVSLISGILLIWAGLYA